MISVFIYEIFYLSATIISRSDSRTHFILESSSSYTCDPSCTLNKRTKWVRTSLSIQYAHVKNNLPPSNPAP